jgi:selenocysteine-specific translation elongation factor
MGLHETKSFCKSKEDTIIGQHSSLQNVKMIFTNPTSDKGLISKIYKELKKLSINRPNNRIFKMGYRAKQNSQQRNLE